MPHAMMALGAGLDILGRYQELQDIDLRVSTAIADPNARGHQDDALAWFWTMDVPQDTAINNWMSECQSFCLVKNHPRLTTLSSLPSSLAKDKGPPGQMGGRGSITHL